MYRMSFTRARLTMLVISCIHFSVQAQEKSPFIKLVDPLKGQVNVTSPRQFIVGSTCPSCSLTVNGTLIKVYPTGAFATEISLLPGDTLFTLASFKADSKPLMKTIRYSYVPLPKAKAIDTFDIEKIETFPAGDLLLLPGDKIEFRVKALPGSNVLVNNTALYEMP